MEKNEKKEQLRLARNAYCKKWRSKNPEKVQKINERFFLKKAQELQARKEQEEQCQ